MLPTKTIPLPIEFIEEIKKIRHNEKERGGSPNLEWEVGRYILECERVSQKGDFIEKVMRIIKNSGATIADVKQAFKDIEQQLDKKYDNAPVEEFVWESRQR